MKLKSVAGYRVRCLALCAVIGALGGCSGGSPLPSLEAAGPAVAARPVANAAVASLPAGATTVASATATHPTAKPGTTIVGFKSATVVLFSSADGTDGERVTRETLNLPLKVRSRGANDRIEIITPEGIRWVASAEAVLTP